MGDGMLNAAGKDVRQLACLALLGSGDGQLGSFSLPSFFRAEISTASQPSSLDSFFRSILSPFLRTRSIMLTAMTTGMPSSISWVVR